MEVYNFTCTLLVFYECAGQLVVYIQISDKEETISIHSATACDFVFHSCVLPGLGKYFQVVRAGMGGGGKLISGSKLFSATFSFFENTPSENYIIKRSITVNVNLFLLRKRALQKWCFILEMLILMMAVTVGKAILMDCE